jgi:hypothetical protein
MSSTIVVFEKGSEALVAPLFGFQGIMIDPTCNAVTQP